MRAADRGEALCSFRPAARPHSGWGAWLTARGYSSPGEEIVLSHLAARLTAACVLRVVEAEGWVGEEEEEAGGRQEGGRTITAYYHIVWTIGIVSGGPAEMSCSPNIQNGGDLSILRERQVWPEWGAISCRRRRPEAASGQITTCKGPRRLGCRC